MRGFLRTAGLILVICAVAGAAAASDFFPQSVATGDPRPDSVVLWTRVESPTDEEPKALLLEVATDEAFVDVVATRELSAWGANDYCVKVMVDGLQPYHDY